MDNQTYSYSLSTEYIKQVPITDYESDFTFYLNDKRILTNKIVAQILSPIIRQYQYTDKVLNTFVITINNPDEEMYAYFSKFLRLASFHDVQISEKERSYFSEFYYALGNYEECYRILQFNLNSLHISIDNCIDILISFRNIQSIEIQETIAKSLCTKEKIEEIVSFIAKNFEIIDKSKLQKLEIDYLEMIFHNESFQIRDEDSLLNFIMSLYAEDPKYSPLFEYVIFANVKSETLEQFVKQFNIVHLNGKIWNSICRRALQYQNTTESFSHSNTQQSHKSVYSILDFARNENEDQTIFDGILKHLSDKNNGNNIHDDEIINITSNSIRSYNDKFHPKNLVEYQNDKLYYCSNNDENTHINFDFKDKEVQLKGYLLKSGKDGPGFAHLRNWIIEASHDETNWIELDRQIDCETMNGSCVSHYFELQSKSNEYYRFIRMHHNGKSWHSHGRPYRIYFYNIEFFGKLKQLVNFGRE